MTLTTVFWHRSRILACAATVLLLAACASVPPPTALMTRAQQQLDAARQAQAGDFAPVDLGFAKKRYQAAQAAMQAKKYDLARDMANESLADARLARMRAQLAAVRRKVRAQKTENSRVRAQLLNQPAAPASTAGNAASGLPSQIVLPQPAAPMPASSTPAPATSSYLPEAAP